MPTPNLYARFAAFANATVSKHKVAFLAALIVAAFAPAVLERAVPQLGPAPGRALFTLLIAYFAAFGPLLAFGKRASTLPPSQGTLVSWLKAMFCTAWLLFCAFFLYSGLAGEA